MAQVLDKALLQAGNGGVEVIAVSREFVSGDAAGMSGGGTAGVGGTLDVVVLRFRTEALTGSNVTIRTTGDLKPETEEPVRLPLGKVGTVKRGIRPHDVKQRLV